MREQKRRGARSVQDVIRQILKEVKEAQSGEVSEAEKHG